MSSPHCATAQSRPFWFGLRGGWKVHAHVRNVHLAVRPGLAESRPAAFERHESKAADAMLTLRMAERAPCPTNRSAERKMDQVFADRLIGIPAGRSMLEFFALIGAHNRSAPPAPRAATTLIRTLRLWDVVYPTWDEAIARFNATRCSHEPKQE